MDHWQRLRVGLGVFAFVVVGGTLGYVLLGFPFLDALYQTVTTITTVGFREIQPLGSGGRVFTIGLIVVGVGTALYTFTLAVQGVVEGEVGRLVGRRRMERSVARLSGHVIVCGWGRVGKAIAAYVTAEGGEVVVVDRDGGRLEDWSGASVVGDATDDGVLRAAGIERAHALVSALTSDADNLFVTLSGRSLRDDLFIVARARVPESEAKLTRAGANRVVNPQSIGGQRMAAFVL
ncbi:MAG: potassium channel family protein [Acidimicrobiia bacterium]